jgi:flagellar L-ring protein precursor FlgH
MQCINRVILAAACLAQWAAPINAQGNSLWERRDPKTAYLFWDYRARLVGDTLTIVISETTESDVQETRNANKQTSISSALNLGGSGSIGRSGTKQFSNSFSAQNQSQRKFDGQANSTIDRKFTDRMSVVVVAVYPNGNLLVEGFRQRLVGRETRTLRLTGIVRPADIGPYNQIQSQYVANVRFAYIGRGQDSAYINNGWGGRIMNILWPY